MRKQLVIAAAAVTLALCGCAHNDTRESAAPSASAISASASPSASAAAANTDAFSGVVTRLTPSTSADGSTMIEITFLLPDGAYRTAGFESAEGVSIGDEVNVDGQSITVASSAPASFDEITMPGLLSAIESADPDFANDHVLGNANRAADFANVDVSSVTNALAILPNNGDATALCYVVTSDPEAVVRGFEDYAGAIVATYEDDPYAPQECTGSCALAENAYIKSGNDWALLIIAPENEQKVLADAVNSWRTSESGVSANE